MKRVGKTLALLGLITVSVSTLFAIGTCSTNTPLGYTYCVQPGTAKYCNTSNTVWCGMGANPALPAYYYGSSGHGFHDYTPGTFSPPPGTPATVDPGFDSQYWLNQHTGTNGPTFSLCNSTTWSSSVTCYGRLVQGSVANQWRAPGAPLPPPNQTIPDPAKTDQGYYLTTTSTSKTTPITITFGSVIKGVCTGCISEFAFYWGSLDSWNYITFTDAAGSSFTVQGSNFFSSLGQNDIRSFVFDFTRSPGLKAWNSVSFSSTSPAFELDNISWTVSSTTCVSPCPGGSPAPGALAPEPSGLVLFLTGAVGIAGALKRKF